MPYVIAESTGLSPVALYEDNLLQGSVIEKEATIFHKGHTESFFVEIKPTRNEIDEWISTDKGFNFIFPADETTQKIKFRVTVPDNAELGSYADNVSIVLHVGDAKAGGNMMGVNMNLLFEIRVKVTDKEFVSYEIKTLHIDPVKEYYHIVPRLVVENTGNVFTPFEKIKLFVYSIDKSQLLYSQEFPLGKEQNIKPFIQDEIKLKLKNKFKKGEYWVKAEVYDAEGIAAAKEAVLTVKENQFNPLFWKIPLLALIFLLLVLISFKLTKK